MKSSCFNFIIDKPLGMKNYLFLLMSAILISGCSVFSDEKPTPPKPVAAKKAAAKHAPKTVQAPAAAPLNNSAGANKQGPGPMTYALDDNNSAFKMESTQAPIKTEAINNTAAAVVAPVTEADNVPVVPSETVAQQTPTTISDNQSAMTMAAYTPEDIRVGSDTAPAVVALVGQADGYRKHGDLDSSVTALERALRIDSRNAALTYKLAQLRLTQHKPQLAEELAGKAALLAGNDLDTKRKSWLLIAEARRQQQDVAGAKAAKAKAQSFFGH
jgi:hypothetical protein